MLAGNHRGKAWKAFEGFHSNRVVSPPAKLAANHRGKAWKAFEGFHTNGVGGRGRMVNPATALPP